LGVHWNAHGAVDSCAPKTNMFYGALVGFGAFWLLPFFEWGVRFAVQRFSNYEMPAGDKADGLIADDKNEGYCLWTVVAAMPAWALIVFLAATIIETNHNRQDCTTAQLPDVSVSILIFAVGASVIFGFLIENDNQKFQLKSDSSPTLISTYWCFSRSLIIAMSTLGATVIMAACVFGIRWKFAAVVGIPIGAMIIFVFLIIGIDLRLQIFRYRGVSITAGPWHLWQYRLFFKDILSVEIRDMRWTSVGGWGVKKHGSVLSFLWRSGEGLFIQLKSSKQSVFVSIDDADKCLRDISDALDSYNKLIQQKLAEDETHLTTDSSINLRTIRDQVL